MSQSHGLISSFGGAAAEQPLNNPNMARQKWLRVSVVAPWGIWKSVLSESNCTRSLGVCESHGISASEEFQESFRGSIVPVLKTIVEYAQLSITSSAKQVLFDISRDMPGHIFTCGLPCGMMQQTWCSLFIQQKTIEKEMFTHKRKGEAYPVWIFGTSFLESQILFHLIPTAQPALESRRFPTLERIHRLRAWHVAAGVMFFLVQSRGEAWRSPTSTYTCTYKDI